MLWMGHYTYFNSFSAGIDFRRQNLTSIDVIFCFHNDVKYIYIKVSNQEKEIIIGLLLL